MARSKKDDASDNEDIDTKPIKPTKPTKSVKKTKFVKKKNNIYNRFIKQYCAFHKNKNGEKRSSQANFSSGAQAWSKYKAGKKEWDKYCKEKGYTKMKIDLEYGPGEVPETKTINAINVVKKPKVEPVKKTTTKKVTQAKKKAAKKAAPKDEDEDEDEDEDAEVIRFDRPKTQPPKVSHCRCTATAPSPEDG